jgi:hypothetical protein
MNMFDLLATGNSGLMGSKPHIQLCTIARCPMRMFAWCCSSLWCTVGEFARVGTIGLRCQVTIRGGGGPEAAHAPQF